MVAKVCLPARRSHPFWREELPGGANGDAYGDGVYGHASGDVNAYGDADATGDGDGDADTCTVTLEWTGWGQNCETARASAQKGVENIIHDLRVRIQQQRQQQSYPSDTNSTVVANTESVEQCWETRANPSASECRILNDGKILCETWKLENSNFLTGWAIPSASWFKGIDSILNCSLPSILTRYYEVPHPHPYSPFSSFIPPSRYPHRTSSSRSTYLPLLTYAVILPTRNAAILHRCRKPNQPALRNRLQNERRRYKTILVRWQDSSHLVDPKRKFADFVELA